MIGCVATIGWPEGPVASNSQQGCWPLGRALQIRYSWHAVTLAVLGLGLVWSYSVCWLQLFGQLAQALPPIKPLGRAKAAARPLQPRL